jgi:hypothetical protein
MVKEITNLWVGAGHQSIAWGQRLKSSSSLRKKGQGGVRKMDYTWRTVLKRKAMNYRMVTAAELESNKVKLRVVFELTIQQTLLTHFSRGK